MIDANVFARYMTAIADRLKFPLSDGTNALYYVTLSEKLTTEEFEVAARKVFAEYDDFGFPPPAIFFAALKQTPVFDSSALLRQIEKLATYNPHVGMIPARVGDIREHFGDIVADAYATAGVDRLGSEDETTRSIAQRDFAKALDQYAAMPDHPRPLIASEPSARRIAARSQKPQTLAAITASIMADIPVPTP